MISYLSACGNGSPEHVAGRELGSRASLDDLGRVRALSSTRGAKEDDDGALFLAKRPPRALKRRGSGREVRLCESLTVL